jgi:hypothetical protein
VQQLCFVWSRHDADGALLLLHLYKPSLMTLQ